MVPPVLKEHSDSGQQALGYSKKVRGTLMGNLRPPRIPTECSPPPDAVCDASWRGLLHDMPHVSTPYSLLIKVEGLWDIARTDTRSG
jgi:hypothetical protein